MIVQYCSDLHLEFQANSQYLKMNPIEKYGDILIIAGDFFLLSKSADKIKWFIEEYSAYFKYIFWLPGNHEYYDSNANEASLQMYKEIAPNFFLINNKTIHFDKLSIIFTTLWSKIHPDNSLDCYSSMNDFRLINYNEKNLGISDYNFLHSQSLEFLKSELSNVNMNNNIVVVTHHVPTLNNYPKRFVKSKINNAFATELSYLTSEYNIKAWIYGHSHVNTKDFSINGTRFLTNQLGYVTLEEHLDFRHCATLSL